MKKTKRLSSHEAMMKTAAAEKLHPSVSHLHLHSSTEGIQSNSTMSELHLKAASALRSGATSWEPEVQFVPPSGTGPVQSGGDQVGWSLVSSACTAHLVHLVHLSVGTQQQAAHTPGQVTSSSAPGGPGSAAAAEDGEDQPEVTVYLPHCAATNTHTHTHTRTSAHLHASSGNWSVL
ncbi:uncharacterized protein V6R79_021519 [Siganus canaliculatus]